MALAPELQPLRRHGTKCPRPRHGSVQVFHVEHRPIRERGWRRPLCEPSSGALKCPDANPSLVCTLASDLHASLRSNPAPLAAAGSSQDLAPEFAHAGTSRGRPAPVVPTRATRSHGALAENGQSCFSSGGAWPRAWQVCQAGSNGGRPHPLGLRPRPALRRSRLREYCSAPSTRGSRSSADCSGPAGDGSARAAPPTSANCIDRTGRGGAPGGLRRPALGTPLALPSAPSGVRSHPETVRSAGSQARRCVPRETSRYATREDCQPALAPPRATARPPRQRST